MLRKNDCIARDIIRSDRWFISPKRKFKLSFEFAYFETFALPFFRSLEPELHYMMFWQSLETVF